MKKLLFTLMLVIVSSGVMAELVEVAKSGEGTEETDFIIVYADPDTIRKKGNKAKMWVLIDYKIIEEEYGATSVRQREEYDCKEKKQRIFFIAFYTGHMGKGETVLIHSEPEARWQQLPTGSIGRITLEYACSFRPKLPRSFPDITFS